MKLAILKIHYNLQIKKLTTLLQQKNSMLQIEFIL